VPNKPDESRLLNWSRRRWNSDRMPPADGLALTAPEIDAIRRGFSTRSRLHRGSGQAEPKDDQALGDLPPTTSRASRFRRRRRTICQRKAEDRRKGIGGKVKALFVQHCVECHGDQKPKSGWVLDRAAMLVADGPVVAGKPDSRNCSTRQHQGDADRMPPASRRPSVEEIQVVEA
jgi:hypothetical protein